MNGFADKNARETANRIAARAKVLAPVDTGRLRASIKVTRTVSFRGPTYTVGTNVTYAPMVETGTKPHIIRPKSKKVLRFKVGGQTVYARVVHHPGTKPKPFLSRATREVGAAAGYNVQITS
jgi:hypothetical protein